MESIPNVTEKFNNRLRYFGYWTGTDKDRIYIYVQKKNLRIDLYISRDFESEIRNIGFKVNYVNNYQGRAGWLTGWQIPHSTTKVETIMKWLCKAFKM